MKSINPAAFAMCLVLASPMAALAQDSAKVESPSNEWQHVMPKDLLKSLVGYWEGMCRTWIEPGKLADVSNVKGEICPMLDGRVLRHTYEGTIQGIPRHAVEIIALKSMLRQRTPERNSDLELRPSMRSLANTSLQPTRLRSAAELERSADGLDIPKPRSHAR